MEESFEGLMESGEACRVFAKGGVCVMIKSASGAVARFDRHACCARAVVVAATRGSNEGGDHGVGLLVVRAEGSVALRIEMGAAACEHVAQLLLALGAAAPVAPRRAAPPPPPPLPLAGVERVLLREALLDPLFAAELRRVAQADASDAARALLLEPRFEDFSQCLATALSGRGGLVPPCAHDTAPRTSSCERIDRACLRSIFEQLRAGGAFERGAAAAGGSAMEVDAPEELAGIGCENSLAGRASVDGSNRFVGASTSARAT